MNVLLIASGFLGFGAVALGAYADHGLRGHIDDHAMRSLETAIRYQMFHALALLAIGVGVGVSATLPALLVKKLLWAGLVMLAGITLFSGSIYANVLFDLKTATKLAPIGGMTLMAGWLMLAWAGMQKSP